MSNSKNIVKADSYLTLHYSVTTLDNNEVIVSTFDLSPATLQMGSGQLAETLESVLLGLEEGEYGFDLPPEQAFGLSNPRLIERIARAALPPEVELKENSLIEFSNPEGGDFAGFLRSLDDTTALFDFNHPLAGKSIRFTVRLIGIM